LPLRPHPFVRRLLRICYALVTRLSPTQKVRFLCARNAAARTDSAQPLATASSATADAAAGSTTLAAQMAVDALVGELLWSARYSLAGKALHIAHDGQLVATVDGKTLRVTVRENLTPAQLKHLVVTQLPPSAAHQRTGFRTTDIWSVLWCYSQCPHTAASATAHLPATFTRQSISLARMPTINLALLKPHHLEIMRLLLSAPHTVAQLQTETCAAPDEVERDVTGLYLIGVLRLANAGQNS
jgi:hypothetical protein